MSLRKTWRERIVAARLRGMFTFQDRMDAGGSWATCAVGEQRAIYGDKVVVMLDKRPADEILFNLGNIFVGFGLAVETDDFNTAERLLDAIEDRALVLKREAPERSEAP